MLYGYARVSTQEQETHAQIDALNAAQVVAVHEEKRSGGTMRRPALETLLAQLAPGDIVVVYKLDRIARSLKDLLTIIERIEAAGASFRSLTEFIDTKSASGRMLMQILGAFAEFELSMIRERTVVGMRAAVARGARLGRPRSMPVDAEAEAMDLWETGAWTKTALAARFDTSIASIKRAIRRAGLPHAMTSELARRAAQMPRPSRWRQLG